MISPLIVFLAEDNPGDVFLVRRALREHGLDCHLIVAENGDKVSQFIERVGTTGPTPDVILLDLNLPRVEGPELFRSVRANPACANVPLIVITSSDSPRDHAWTSEYRVSHYFRKPSSLDEFLKLGAVIRDLVTVTACDSPDLEGPIPAARL